MDSSVARQSSRRRGRRTSEEDSRLCRDRSGSERQKFEQARGLKFVLNNLREVTCSTLAYGTNVESFRPELEKITTRLKSGDRLREGLPRWRNKHPRIAGVNETNQLKDNSPELHSVPTDGSDCWRNNEANLSGRQRQQQ